MTRRAIIDNVITVNLKDVDMTKEATKLWNGTVKGLKKFIAENKPKLKRG